MPGTCPEGVSAEECPALLEQQALVPAGTCPEGASAEECTLLQQANLVLDPDGCPEGTLTNQRRLCGKSRSHYWRMSSWH